MCVPKSTGRQAASGTQTAPRERGPTNRDFLIILGTRNGIPLAVPEDGDAAGKNGGGPPLGSLSLSPKTGTLPGRTAADRLWNGARSAVPLPVQDQRHPAPGNDKGRDAEHQRVDIIIDCQY